MSEVFFAFWLEVLITIRDNPTFVMINLLSGPLEVLV